MFITEGGDLVYSRCKDRQEPEVPLVSKHLLEIGIHTKIESILVRPIIEHRCSEWFCVEQKSYMKMIYKKSFTFVVLIVTKISIFIMQMGEGLALKKNNTIFYTMFCIAQRTNFKCVFHHWMFKT